MDKETVEKRKQGEIMQVMVSSKSRKIGVMTKGEMEDIGGEERGEFFI